MVYVEGNWDVQLKTGGEFYKQFEINLHVNNGVYNPDLALHISWDDNVNPYLPCGIFQINVNTIQMIDEIAGETPKNTVKEVCKVINEKYKHHNSGMFIYGDATANKQDTKLEKGHNFYTLIMDYLSDFKPVNRVQKSNPSVIMRGGWINNIFESNNEIIFKISEKCHKAISDLVSLKEAPDGTKLKETAKDPKTGATYQKFGHFSDLIDYLLCSAFEKQFKDYQKTPLKKKKIIW